MFVDGRWPWPLALVRPTQMPGSRLYPWPKGKVTPTKLEAEAYAILRSDSTRGFHGTAGRTDALNAAFAHIESGHEGFTGRDVNTEFPFEGKLFCRACNHVDGWVELVHEIVVVLAPANAVVLASRNEGHLQSMLYGIGGASDAIGDHPGREVARVNAMRRELGARYVRPAAWGTYLAPAHVKTIGRQALVAAAATSREVGELLYLQCSASAADAFTPEADERRAALRALLAPIS